MVIYPQQLYVGIYIIMEYGKYVVFGLSWRVDEEGVKQLRHEGYAHQSEADAQVAGPAQEGSGPDGD